MVGRSVSSAMAESEIASLKEALQAQQQLLQKIYKELEEEREASATAASEALSMILRLQGEKAAEKLEASQYKRMIEEKMHYAEECLSVFEDLMYSKEMEIASLEFQIQAYRYKLLSLGYTDQYLRRNENQIEELGLPRNMRRIKSLPPIPLKDPQSKKGKVGNEGSAASWLELIAGKNDEEIQVVSEESEVGDFNSYCEQIKSLDERVKELSYRRVVERSQSDLISRNQDLSLTMAAASSKLRGVSRTCLLSTAVSRDLSLEPMGSSKAEDSSDVLGFDASSIPCLESETITSSIHSTTVHNVFEVPQNHENHKFCVSQKQEQKKLIFKGETRLRKQQSVPPETSEYYFKEKDEWLKKVLIYAHRENTLPKATDGVTADYHLRLSDPNINVSPFQSEVQQLKKRIELLEDDRRIIKQEASSNIGEEQLRLLREINEQLKVIQSEIDKRDESKLLSLIEAMLCCSL